MSKIQQGFESWAKANGFDMSCHGGRYDRPVVRWMWAAWQVQAESCLFTDGKRLPDYLIERIDNAVGILRDDLLGEAK